MVESLSFSSKEKEIDLKDFSKNLQSELTDTTAVFNQLLKERMQDTPAAGAETGDIGVFIGELDKLYQEASTVALDNKLELIVDLLTKSSKTENSSNKTNKSVVIQITALRREIDTIMNDLKKTGLVSVSRTGAVAMTRGAEIFK